METIKGRAAMSGIAFGKLAFFTRDEQNVQKHKIGNPDVEFQRYDYAKEMALTELNKLYEREIEFIGKDHADIFAIHQALIEDEEFVGRINQIITDEQCNADYAVHLAANQIASELGRSEDEYIRARTADIKDVSRRLIRLIQNKSEQVMDFSQDTILCCYDIEPSETVRIDKSNVKAVCTCYGSASSHSAILARSMNLPSIVALGKQLSEKLDGCEAIVDAYSGTLYINPDRATKLKMMLKREQEGRKHELLKRLRGRKNITLDGTEIKIYANISGLMDLKYAEENDAGGIGLMRSEFLYLHNDDFPDEELQFYTYRRALEKMDGKTVTVRTLDIGADKDPDYFDAGSQENPAMGMRSLRICFERPEIFRTQLRALYRASVYGRLAVLIPMVIDVEDLIAVRKMISDVCRELDDEGLPYSKEVKLGVMIETPAAVMLSDELAKEADFFSIGTNDLEQYTLAIDRQNPMLEKFCRPHHLAVLRMIKIATDNAHACGIPVEICGELGGVPEFAEIFLSMGIDIISVSPPRILPLRKKIRSIRIEDKNKILEKNRIIKPEIRTKTL